MRQAGEPSVEAILESIKQVIARDNRAITAAGLLAPAGEGRVNGEASAGADDDRGAVLDLADSDFAAPDEPAGDGATAVQQPAEKAPPALAAESTQDAVRGALDSVMLAAESARASGIEPSADSGEGPFEALLREMLRPALAEWLDRHLPAMVERLVAAEIARMVRRRG